MTGIPWQEYTLSQASSIYLTYSVSPGMNVGRFYILSTRNADHNGFFFLSVTLPADTECTVRGSIGLQLHSWFPSRTGPSLSKSIILSVIFIEEMMAVEELQGQTNATALLEIQIVFPMHDFYNCSKLVTVPAGDIVSPVVGGKLRSEFMYHSVTWFLQNHWFINDSNNLESDYLIQIICMLINTVTCFIPKWISV